MQRTQSQESKKPHIFHFEENTYMKVTHRMSRAPFLEQPLVGAPPSNIFYHSYVSSPCGMQERISMLLLCMRILIYFMQRLLSPIYDCIPLEPFISICEFSTYTILRFLELALIIMYVSIHCKQRQLGRAWTKCDVKTL